MLTKEEEKKAAKQRFSLIETTKWLKSGKSASENQRRPAARNQWRRKRRNQTAKASVAVAGAWQPGM